MSKSRGLRKLICRRRVIDGRVNLHGSLYRPGNQRREYDGSLEGKLLHFGLFPQDALRTALEPFVYCLDSPVIDGTLPWCFWVRVGAAPERHQGRRYQPRAE